MPRKKIPKQEKLAKRRVRRKIKELEAAQRVTPKQSLFIKAFAETRNKTLAALAAGYAKEHAAQSGYQALKQVQKKAPDVIAAMGITLENVIENNILPLMQQTETLVAQHEGKFTDTFEIEMPAIRLGATRTLLELMNAFPPEDQKLAAQLGVKVVVMDAPRPDFSKMRNVTPPMPAAAVLEPPNGSQGNGAKPKRGDPGDPRPKD